MYANRSSIPEELHVVEIRVKLRKMASFLERNQSGIKKKKKRKKTLCEKSMMAS